MCKDKIYSNRNTYMLIGTQQIVHVYGEKKFLRNIDMNMKLESLTNMGFGHCVLVDIECIYIYKGYS